MAGVGKVCLVIGYDGCRICDGGMEMLSMFGMGVVNVSLGIVHWYRILCDEVETYGCCEDAVSRNSTTVVIFIPPLLSCHFCLLTVEWRWEISVGNCANAACLLVSCYSEYKTIVLFYSLVVAKASLEQNRAGKCRMQFDKNIFFLFHV